MDRETNCRLYKIAILWARTLYVPPFFSNHDEEDSLEDATATEDEDDDEELSDELEDNWANSTATGDNWTDYDQDIYMHR